MKRIECSKVILRRDIYNKLRKEHIVAVEIAILMVGWINKKY